LHPTSRPPQLVELQLAHPEVECASLADPSPTRSPIVSVGASVGVDVSLVASVGASAFVSARASTPVSPHGPGNGVQPGEHGPHPSQ
jgi:hypothetical protein